MLLGLGSVAFVTLLERKLLSLRQLRLGPNKLTFGGALQPVFDGIKLLLKEFYHIIFIQRIFFLFRPIVLLVIFLSIWSIILPWDHAGVLVSHLTFLLFISILGCGRYATIVAGWATTRPFSKLGRLRGLLQGLSFEVALVLILLFPLIFYGSLMAKNEVKIRLEAFLWIFLWLALSLVERNRAPFDLLEGERELIRGFNVETRRTPFVLIFLREYGTLLALSLVAGLGLLGDLNMISIIFISLLLFLRSCFPRIRYDILMSFMWQRVLPLRLFPAIALIFAK